MFNFLKRKKEKDPICGMTVGENFISQYGEKFCSEKCLKEYEKKQQDNHSGGHNHNCGCC